MGKPEKLPPGPSAAKRRILTAAAQLFRERGFARSTVRELADAVGILSGSLFHHFKSKDDILFTVMEEVIIQMDDALAVALEAAPTTEAKLRALIHTHLDFIHGPQGDATAILIYEWNALSSEGQSRLLARRARYFERWQVVLEEARGLGLTSVSPSILRQLLHGATVWTANWFDKNGSMTLAELEQAVMSLVLAPKKKQGTEV